MDEIDALKAEIERLRTALGMQASRPEYCLGGSEGQPDYLNPCPCGATAAGDDPVKGVCQALKMRAPSRPLVEIVVVPKYPHRDTRTGETQ